MAREYDRFVATPVGPSLIVADGGLTLTTLAASLSLERTARGSVGHDGGTHGAEFVFWGDDALVAAVGVVTASASLSARVGAAAGGIGWRLADGTVWKDGTQIASGLSIPAKGDVVGVRILDAPGAVSVEFWAASGLQYTATAAVGAWFFAVSLGSTTAGGLACAVNAGQWPALTAAARAAWQPAVAAVLPVGVSDVDWIAGQFDPTPNLRFEGVMTGTGLELDAQAFFWPSAEPGARQALVAQVNAADPDGVLAVLLLSDPVEGLPVDIRHVDAAGSWAGSDSIARLELDSVEAVSDSDLVLRFRDPHAVLDEPVNRGVFLPYVPALAWQPQPLVIGACASVPVLSVNSDATVGFVADAPIEHVADVMDRGDPLDPADYALVFGGQLSFDSPPLGPVVADVSSVGPGMVPATLEHALHNLFSRVGFGAWNSTDAAAIDTATGYAGIGLYIGGQQVSVRAAVAQVLASYCAWYWQDAAGVIRITRLVDPATGTPAAELDPAELIGDLSVAYDAAPYLTLRAGYRPNALQLAASDIVTDLVDVPPARRAELAGAYRGTVYSRVRPAARYAAAERRAPFPSLFWEQADAQAELDRVCGLYAVERRVFRWSVAEAETVHTPGQVVTISYDRHGLEAGKQVMVVGARWNPVTGNATYVLWG